MYDPHARATSAYANGAKAGFDQRQLEANALLKAATRLEAVRERWQPELTRELDEALLYNRKLWTIFASEAADGAGRLPDSLRNNVGSLAVFIFKRTFELMASPEPAKIGALVDINRNIAAGLLTRQAEADQATQPVISPNSVGASC